MSKKDTGIVSLKGKQYYTVSKRVADFRAAHPIADAWGITTSIKHMDDTTIIFRAAVVNPHGSEVAVGYAEEVRSSRGVNSTSALENAETSAIGRALAAAGYGGDGAYASADELVNALSQQRQPRPARDTRGSMEWTGAALEAAGVSRDRFTAYQTEKGWAPIEGWGEHHRIAFVEDVKNGDHPDLYKPGES